MQSLVRITRALADETRLRILAVLLEGEATVNDLVSRLGLPQPRISTHLALLRQAGLVAVATVGRQRVYRTATDQVEHALAALRALAPEAPRRSPQAAREVRRNTAMRQARTCYDHLAGVAGVQLLETMCERGWLAPEDDAEPQRRRYRMTSRGTHALQQRGVDVAQARAARRRFAYGCPDWTERRPHLGGALGAAILTTLLATDLVRRQPTSRTLTVRQGLDAWLRTDDRA